MLYSGQQKIEQENKVLKTYFERKCHQKNGGDKGQRVGVMWGMEWTQGKERWECDEARRGEDRNREGGGTWREEAEVNSGTSVKHETVHEK